jgi:Taurine catabolism dioxygenase TauD, TfdA family.
MKKACKLSDEISFDLSWEKNDIVIINNMMVMHGRKPFFGRRSILASLAIDNKEDPMIGSQMRPFLK